MKKIFLILFLTFTVILPLKVNALSVSNNNLTIEPKENKTIDLYANVETEITEVNFTLIYTSYDVPGYFNVESGLTDSNGGINHKITLATPQTGKIKLGTVKINVVSNPTVNSGSVNIHSAKAITTTGETITLNNQIINVTVGRPEIVPEEDYPTVNEPDVKDDDEEPEETEENKNTNLLEKIESSIVNIKLKDGVYEYSVKINEEVEELDLKPIVKDEKYKVEITTQKISELSDEQIIIKVKDGEKEEEYKIKVNIAKNVEIDKTEFEPSFKYKNKWLIMIIVFGVALFAGLILTKKK